MNLGDGEGQYRLRLYDATGRVTSTRTITVTGKRIASVDLATMDRYASTARRLEMTVDTSGSSGLVLIETGYENEPGSMRYLAGHPTPPLP